MNKSCTSRCQAWLSSSPLHDRYKSYHRESNSLSMCMQSKDHLLQASFRLSATVASQWMYVCVVTCKNAEADESTDVIIYAGAAIYWWTYMDRYLCIALFKEALWTWVNNYWCHHTYMLGLRYIDIPAFELDNIGQQASCGCQPHLIRLRWDALVLKRVIIPLNDSYSVSCHFCSKVFANAACLSYHLT